MSMQIDQILAQIRALSAQASGGPGAGFGPAGLGPRVGAAAAGLDRPAGAGSVAGTPGTDFGQLLKSAVGSVNHDVKTSDALAAAFERGAPGVDLAQVMIESQKASVSFQALTQVRNRLISAYQDIMNMPT